MKHSKPSKSTTYPKSKTGVTPPKKSATKKSRCSSKRK